MEMFGNVLRSEPEQVSEILNATKSVILLKRGQLLIFLKILVMCIYALKQRYTFVLHSLCLGPKLMIITKGSHLLLLVLTS